MEVLDRLNSICKLVETRASGESIVPLSDSRELRNNRRACLDNAPPATKVIHRFISESLKSTTLRRCSTFQGRGRSDLISGLIEPAFVSRRDFRLGKIGAKSVNLAQRVRSI